MDLNKQDIANQIERSKDDLLNDYKTIVESPSISALQSHKPYIQETAEIAVKLIEKHGGQAQIIPTSGNPVVYGKIENDPQAQTIAIYNHLDVQPAEKGKDGWTRDPFDFTFDNGRFYSRGATDDKGPAMTALWAASIAKTLGCKTNVEFIWELEEEIGSPNFEDFLNKKIVTADNIVISDTIWASDTQPAMSMSLRGNVAAIVRLEVGTKDVHSGMAGGPARNPLSELSELIAKCVDKQGNITIPGFEDTWTPISEQEKAGYAQSGFSIDYFKRAHGLTSLRSNNPLDIMEAVWAKPTFEVHGIVGGYQGEGVKTVVPPRAEAKISFRVVPGQDPDKVYDLFAAYAKQIIPDCTLEKERAAQPFSCNLETPLIPKIEDAIEFGFSKRPVKIREGGSIGAIVSMQNIIQKPIGFLGISLPEDNYHGPDESFAWQQMQGGVYAFTHLFCS